MNLTKNNTDLIKSQINKLHNFISNNYNLEELEIILNEFNLFNVLKISHHEIRHSNVIAWLLDPYENHNLGIQFFKKFMAEVLLKNENIDTKLSSFDIHTMKYGDYKVLREKNNIDIFLKSEKEKWIIYIENKIHAPETEGQLKRYFENLDKKYRKKKYEIIPIYLSLDGSPPSDSNYAIMSYSQILHILKFLARTNEMNTSSKVIMFINQYIKVLEILIMENEEIKDLCKKIYNEHSDAIDLIVKYSEDTEFENASSRFIREKEAKTIYIDGKVAWFIPKQFLPLIGKVGDGKWANGYPFSFWFWRGKDQMGLIIEIGPFIDGSKRREFLNLLKLNKIKIHDYSFKENAKYTRISTSYPDFKDWDNVDEIVNEMDSLFIEANEISTKLLNACKTFSW